MLLFPRIFRNLILKGQTFGLSSLDISTITLAPSKTFMSQTRNVCLNSYHKHGFYLAELICLKQVAAECKPVHIVKL